MVTVKELVFWGLLMAALLAAALYLGDPDGLHVISEGRKMYREVPPPYSLD